MNENSESWVDIPNYENLYSVSTKGRVKSYRTNRVLRPSIGNSGYYQVTLCVDKKKKSFMIHRLVGKCFIPNPNGYLELNHKDENKLNNVFENLEWCTRSYNNAYGTARQRANLSRDNHLIALKGAAKHDYNKIAKVLSQKINQYTLENKLIRSWDSMRKAAKSLGISLSEICNCCNNKKESFKGYIWRKHYEK